jgi:ParB-like chromosome segregation protein Spo0J
MQRPSTATTDPAGPEAQAGTDTGMSATTDASVPCDEEPAAPSAEDKPDVSEIPQPDRGTNPTDAASAPPTPPDGHSQDRNPAVSLTPNTRRVPINSVQIGQRFRKSMGDLSDLVESIGRLGQLQPIVVTPERRLIAGARRLAALEKLGRDEVLIHVVEGLDDAVKALAAERDENSCRSELRPTEAAKLARALMQLERPKARQRQAQAGPRSGRGKKATASGKLPEADKGESREKAARAAGMSATNQRKVEAVVDAAEREPEKYQDVRDEMDETGNVHKAYKIVTNQSTKQQAPTTLPNSPEDIVDVLWRVRGRDVCAKVHHLLEERLRADQGATEPDPTPVPAESSVPMEEKG